MAMDHSSLLELLEALKAAGVDDRIRLAAQNMYQELIDAEAEGVIGAGLWERTAERTAVRNGSRPRTLSTTAGDLELRIPTLRTGSFFPSLLERRRRIDQALFAVVMEAYLHGVSTRKVDDLVKALGADTGISKSEVSRICKDLDAEVAAFRDRSLKDTAYPYVFLDATYCKARVNHRVVSQAIVVAVGVSADGRREVLGMDVGDSEDGAFWTAFLRGLKTRGLGGVQLVISDAHAGLKQAIATVFIGASWQRCRVHFMRNVLAVVPKGNADMVAAAIRTIFAQPDAKAVHATWEQVRDQLAKAFPKIGPLTTPRPRSWRSPRSRGRTGPRSGPTTPSSGSTRRSNAEPAWWASSPTRAPSSASSALSWPTPTTNGKSATGATSPKPRWRC